MIVSNITNRGCESGRLIPDLSKQEMDRFWRRVVVGKEHDCWHWKGPFGTGQYGAFTLRGKSYRAHRIAFFLSRGPFEWKQLVTHICDNPSCCNPLHLTLRTPMGNFDDMVSKGRYLDASDVAEMRRFNPFSNGKNRCE